MATIKDAGGAQIEAAARNAAEAFDIVTSVPSAALLLQIADVIEAHLQELA
ncbi:MAG: hypothetical protein AAF222_02430 [Pseudomonadota bacterium]